MEDFIVNLAEQFDEMDPSELNEDTVFQELDTWSSLAAMGIIAMAKLEYGKSITGRDVRNCLTVKSLYDMIMSK